MKKLIILAGFLTLNSFMFSQSFVQENKLWNVFECINFGGCWTHSFKLQGDTTLSQFNYKKLYTTNDSTLTNWGLSGAMRENDNQVFLYLFYNNEETLIYDFNLSIGDTFSTTIFYDCQIELTVEEIDTVTILNGEHRERYTFTDGEQWIKGIGSLYGPVYVGIYWCEADMFYELSCCFENEEQIYQSPNYEECINITVGVNEINEQIEHTIYPNPFTTTTKLKFDYSSSQTYRLQIINQTGRLQQTIENITSGEVIIDRDKLETGIYFYRLQNSCKTIASGKFIVKE